MHRAYSLCTVKDFDPEKRTFGGLASHPEPDRVGDVIEPKGIRFKDAVPLMLYHDSHKPVGEARFAGARADGMAFAARISTIARTTGTVRDRLDEAVDSLNADPPLIRAVSIGFKPLEPPTFIKETGGWRYGSIEVLELSMVVIPANQNATIQYVKSLDANRSAASGTGRSAPHHPGASGSRRDTHMNTSEQLTAEKATLQIKSARLEELMNADEQNNGLEADEAAERDTLLNEVKSITAKVSRLSTLEAAQAGLAGALTIAPTQTQTHTQQTQRTATQFKTVELPKGTLFTRYAMAVAAGKGSMSDTIAYAKRWTNTPEVLQYIKAQEGTAFGGSPTWGTELVNPNTMQTEFVELLRPMTIIGRVQGFRNVPFNIPIITQTGGSTFDWVGEGAVKPKGELSFERTTMPTSKVAGIVVLTEELIRLSTPAAEETVRRDLIEQCARFLDEQFIRVAVSAGANNPASITNNVTSPAASGTDVGALLADLNAALATFDDSENGADVVIVTTKALARGISSLLVALGTPAFPSMSPTGGTLMGYPVIVSNSVDAGTVVLFQPSEILLADDGQVRLDSSNQATLTMSGGSSTPDFNLWERNCVGIRAERWIRWQKRREDVVAVIDTASYGPTVGSV